MKKTCLALTLLAAVCLGGREARAVIGTIDAVPAATLLLPYFEVDLAAQGATTLMSINNASATATLVHVVVWSDLSVPVLDFNIYLTGFDVQTINLRDIFVNGVLPRTASAGQDPSDTISPKGTYSQDINYASCGGILPYGPLGTVYVTHLQNALSGKASAVLGGLCAGISYGDTILRGYVTADVANACSVEFPASTGYFISGGSGLAGNRNIIWGDYFHVNEGQGFAQGDTLVHIEASATDPQTSVAGQYTFYGRYVNWLATDNREPLATTFATRYVTGGTFSGGTSLATWRDSKVNQGAFTCPALIGVRPSWYPLAQEGIVIFDEQETPNVPPVCTVSPCVPGTGLIPFPAEAQRTRVGGSSLPVPFTFGWIYADLNTTVVAAGSNPPEDPAAAQAWMTTIMDAQGRFSVGYSAIQLDSATTAQHTIPGGP